MSMDRIGAASMPNLVGRTGTGLAKAQPGANGASIAPAVPSFFALLTALEPDADPELVANAAAALDGCAAAQPPLAPSDPLALQAQNPIPAAATAEPATLVLAAEDEFPAGAAGRRPLARMPHGMRGVADLAAPDGSVICPAAASAASVAKKPPDVGALEAPMLDAGSLFSAKSAAVAANQARLAADMGGAQTGNTALDRALFSGAMAPADQLAAGTRGVDRPLTQRWLAPAASVLAGSWAEPAFASPSATPGVTYAPDATAPVPEAALAEKVSYWISSGVQKAELQLEAFGGGSVEVSISVHGNEALVEFGTDQPQARKLLQDAMPHLKEMLEQQGLVLSGGFVGTSAQHGRGGQERRGNVHNANLALVSAKAHTGGETPANLTPRGSVDVFV